MPTEQQWYVPERVVRVRFYGKLTLDEIVDAFATSAELVDATSAPPVHFIHDWTELDSFPTNIIDIRRSTTVRVKDPKRIGWVVAYAKNDQILQSMSNIVFQLFRIRFQMVDSADEAVAFLQRMDSKLPPLPALT